MSRSLYRNRKIHVGTVSHGTLREQDLIPAFLDTLAYYKPHWARACAKLYDYPIDGFDTEKDLVKFCCTENAYQFIENLRDELDGIAPPLTYFGEHYGDCSDFGFWYVDFDELIRQGDLLRFDNDTRNPTRAELEGYEYFARVNDHGNITVFGRNYREIAAIV
jgi:hypothetical protein